MHKRHAWSALVAIAVALDGCSSAPSGARPPSTLALSPSSLAFSATGQSQPVMVTDPNYTGTFTTSGCGGIVTAALARTTVTVTSVAAGICTLTVSDTAGSKANVSITVTTSSIPVQ
jgi:uncharacterized protein YceK